MQQYDVVIIGASAAGVTAAITARRHYPEKSILVLRKEILVPIPCGIPYTFGVVGIPEKNLIPADDLFSKNSIATVVGEVIEIDRSGSTVVMSKGERFGYQRLVIATGSNPVVPPLPGIGQPPSGMHAWRRNAESEIVV